jgi:hypothetical protein
MTRFAAVGILSRGSTLDIVDRQWKARAREEYVGEEEWRS